MHVTLIFVYSRNPYPYLHIFANLFKGYRKLEEVENFLISAKRFYAVDFREFVCLAPTFPQIRCTPIERRMVALEIKNNNKYSKY